MQGAAVGEPGRLYAAGGDGLLAVERDRRTGRFAATPLGMAMDAPPLAHDPAGERLLGAGAEGLRWFALGKAGAAPPALDEALGLEPPGVPLRGPPARAPAPDEAVNGLAGCALAALGPGSAVDVFCDGAALSLGADGRATAIALPEGGAPVGAAASPDGQHVYVSTRSGEILTFERAFPSSSDDHGDGQATATRVAIPSTTAGYLDAGERDYFRVDLDQAGSFTAETTGSTDTWGFIEYGEHGFVLADSNDDGEGENFRFTTGRLEAGTYYVVVEGFSPSTRGAYSLVLTEGGGGPPAAEAPSVSIDAVPAGDEGTAVGLSATLTGGAYDGAPEYAWRVTGGALDNPSSATPTWTRPDVNADTSYAARLTVTVRGAGTNARNGTSDTARASRTALVRDVPPQLPAADAPSVSINAVPAGDEGASVTLGASLSGGTYDGALEYAWQADGGALSDPASATPTWTRPPVTSNASHTLRLTVTARGTGANARNGTSDTADASRSALVRDTAAALPAASAPSVSINAIADGDEGTAVQLGAALTGGAYDGAPEYDWDVSGGALDDDTSATPSWTRPAVNADTNHTVSLTVTVRGAGTAARNATSDTGSADRAARVLDAAPPPASSCVDDAKWKTVADYYDHNATNAPNYGANWYRVLIAYRLEDPERTLPAWQGSTAQPTTRYTAEEATDGEAAWSGWTPVREVLDCLERAFPALPAAAAPAVSVDAVPAGDEGTKVGLSAALTGGAYDGAVEYAWSVSGGALDNPSSATPTWTRPPVTSNTNHTVSLEVTVQGAGTNAQNGTSATANASVDAEVRDVPPQLPVADAPAVSVNAIPAGDENTAVQLGATLAGGTYDGAPEYAWTVTGGALDNPSSATPAWTRPLVTSDTSYTARVTVTVHGTGANARNGTSDTASADRSAQVRDTTTPPATSCVDDAKWKTVADYYDHNATNAPNYGANWYRVLIALPAGGSRADASGLAGLHGAADRALHRRGGDRRRGGVVRLDAGSGGAGLPGEGVPGAARGGGPGGVGRRRPGGRRGHEGRLKRHLDGRHLRRRRGVRLERERRRARRRHVGHADLDAPGGRRGHQPHGEPDGHRARRGHERAERHERHGERERGRRGARRCGATAGGRRAFRLGQRHPGGGREHGGATRCDARWRHL